MRSHETLRLLALAAFVPLCTLPACAVPARADTDCSAALSTVDIEACQKKNFALADAALNAQYAKTLATFPADQQAKLRDAETKWIAFRDADCGVYTGSQTGTIAGIRAGACEIARTKARLGDLREFARPEGP